MSDLLVVALKEIGGQLGPSAGKRSSLGVATWVRGTPLPRGQSGGWDHAAQHRRIAPETGVSPQSAQPYDGRR